MDQNQALVRDIVDRMKSVIGVSKDVDLADHLGGSRSSLSVWRKRGSIPVDECIKLALEKNISLDWLMLGRGQRDHEEPAADEGNDLFVELPLFDMATGSTDPLQQAWWTMPRSWLQQEGVPVEDAAILRVAGDAHAGGIEDGQMVLIDRRQRPHDGVFLVVFGGALRIRRVQHMVDGSLRLTADNDAYTADVVRDESPTSFEIIGHCYAAFRRVR
ncbi:helix-turn-helix domain-containing protein [Cupriavidus sp. UGS-1]|uniref:helix-turn-helix domain-containing protein n=1 Tax=Cupriavidus sp. UGS-1 TaxID=2899826 RepID=UPI001E285404|nr:helix-turn-helix domain-containing protein [Cupriavidus sp. UGS-1]MCD9124010.1 helix-turn-helix domain-containing protein [Cupriavidus sp. UGS-1]